MVTGQHEFSRTNSFLSDWKNPLVAHFVAVYMAELGGVKYAENKKK
jgi:hypothetical protein